MIHTRLMKLLQGLNIVLYQYIVFQMEMEGIADLWLI